jgi:ketosteroid isomerase-like protein
MTQQSDGLHAAVLDFVAQVNGGQAGLALAYFSDDVVIVMDLPPYRLEGAGAGMQWLQMMGGNAAKLGVSAVALHPAEPRRIEADYSTGYIILPGTLKLDGDERHLSAQGELTMAARFVDGGWKFCAMTWAGGEPV